MTATEFHDSLRQGQLRSGADVGQHTPEFVAEAILRAVETGDEEIVLARG